MKTLKNLTGMKLLSYFALTAFLSFTSCKDNNTIDYTANDNSNLQSESNSDAQMEDISAMASVAMIADAGTQTGGKAGEATGAPKLINIAGDERFSCATITLEFANDNVPGTPATANPHGTITIDFGNTSGCKGPNGRVRKGKIVIEFKGRRFVPGSYVTLTFVDFSVDGIKVEGTRTETNVTESTESAPKMHITEIGVKVTYLDGTFATRTVDRTRTWHRENNPLNDTWTVTGGASGVTRKGREYVMTITKELLFKVECALSSKVVIAVQGTKELVADAKKLTIDFGTGACDTKVTLSINGKSKEVEVTASGD